MQPAAVDAAIAHRDAASGLHAQGAGEGWVAAQQPQLPAAAALFQHRPQVCVESFQVFSLPQALPVGGVAYQYAGAGGWLEVAAVAGLQLDCSRHPRLLQVYPGLGQYLGALLQPHHGGQGAAVSQVAGAGQAAGGGLLLVPDFEIEIRPALQRKLPLQPRRPPKYQAHRLNQQGAAAAEGIGQGHRAIPAAEGDQARCEVFLQGGQAHRRPVAAAVQAAAAAIEAEAGQAAAQMQVQAAIGLV